jgi:hypothetical protein
VISKKLLRKKNHVAYMKSEREILTLISCPFVVSLRFAFQTDTKLFLVCYAMLCCAMLCYAVLCYAMLCYVVL